jgi:hypothetical protein
MSSSIHQLATAIGLLTVSFLSPATAQVRVQRPVVEEFLAVCPTAVFKPGELQQVLDSRGLIKKSESNSGGQKVTVYGLKQTEGLGISVDVSTAADSQIERCVATGGRTTTADDIYGVKAALEGDALVGPLEGSVTQIGPDAWNGKFERPDTHGLIGFGATVLAGGRATVLSLARQTRKVKG